ncbi:MAG: cytochrome P450, partial [Candidatus Binataceae bacterium]
KPATWENPYPAYSFWRARSPFIARIPFVLPDGSELEAYSWLVLKHDEVYGVLRDHETFSSDFPPVPNGPPRLPLIQDDPPRHSVLRRIVNKAFTARRIAQLEPWIRETAAELLAAMGSGEADVVASLAIPLPVRVIARLLGIPGSDYLTFKRWSDSFLIANARAVDPDSRLRNSTEMARYFGQIAAERRTKGAEDLVTALVDAELDGRRLAEPELLGFCILLLIAGNETTTNLISNLLNLLAARPELWRRIRENRALVEGTIEETLRYESPVQALYRWVRREAEIGGRQIFPNTVVAVGFGSANRDPLAFPDAEEFNIERDWTRHLAFGSGIHYCLGAPLARVEAAVALNAMLDRYQTIAPGSRPGTRQSASNVIFGFTQLPLQLGGS